MLETQDLLKGADVLMENEEALNDPATNMVCSVLHQVCTDPGRRKKTMSKKELRDACSHAMKKAVTVLYDTAVRTRASGLDRLFSEVLEDNSGLCLDNDKEREALREALVARFLGARKE